MPVISLTPELKSVMLFSAAGIATGGLSAFMGSASIAGIIGIAVLYVLRKFAIKSFNMDASMIMQNGIMPYLTFWYAVWVVLTNV